MIPLTASVSLLSGCICTIYSSCKLVSADHTGPSVRPVGATTPSRSAYEPVGAETASQNIYPSAAAMSAPAAYSGRWWYTCVGLVSDLSASSSARQKRPVSMRKCVIE